MYLEQCQTVRHYAVQVHPARGAYLLGALGTEARKYDPFESMTDILFALMRIGVHYRNGEDICYAAREFCARFGFLGFEQADVQKRYDDGSVKLYRGNVLCEKALLPTQIEQLFRPFQRELNRQHRRTQKSAFQALSAGDGSEEPLVPELDYSYCERVEWYGKYGAQLLQRAARIQCGEPFELLIGNAEQVFRCENGRVTRRWRFDSLKTACDIGFAEMLLAEVPAIRLCKRCGKPLLTNGTRAAYCSASCRNVENVKNSRLRKQGKSNPNTLKSPGKQSFSGA